MAIAWKCSRCGREVQRPLGGLKEAEESARRDGWGETSDRELVCPACRTSADNDISATNDEEGQGSREAAQQHEIRAYGGSDYDWFFG